MNSKNSEKKKPKKRRTAALVIAALVALAVVLLFDPCNVLTTPTSEPASPGSADTTGGSPAADSSD